MKLLVINGPNLNMLGIREPDIYGANSYQQLKKFIKEISKKNNISIKMVQSNCEGKIIDYLHQAYFKGYDGIVINPGAYTHYSYAIYDAIKAIRIKTVEVHLSDVHNRDDFRKNLITTKACSSMFCGKGFVSYQEAIEYLIKDE